MDKGSSRLHSANDGDDDDDCCMKNGRRVQHKSTNEALFHRLAVIIKARHLQLGGYSHDEHEHLLQAKQLLQMGHESQARLEVQLALQKRALHKRESLKYQNLVALRDTLQEAQRNLTLAQVMQEGAGVVQDQLSRLSRTDLRTLQRAEAPSFSGAANEGVSRPLLVSMQDSEGQEDEEEEPAPPTVTEEEVATQLALLRLPPTPTTTAAAAATAVPVSISSSSRIAVAEQISDK